MTSVFGEYIIETFCRYISGHDQTVHTFHLLQYTGWPEYEAPTTTDSIFLLIKAVRKLVVEKSNNAKILVHCSSGTGRSGTFIALYQLMDVLDKNVVNYKRGRTCILSSTNEPKIDVFNTLFQLTRQRSEMVSTFKGYINPNAMWPYLFWTL